MKTEAYLRIVSAVILAILFISSILWVKTLFYLLMTIVAIGMLAEWFNMLSSRYFLLSLGLVIIPFPIACLIAVRSVPTSNLLLLTYFLTIWATDTFAMIGGKIFQGPKLAPHLSPNKTWSGLICGMLAAGLTFFFSNIFNTTLTTNYSNLMYNIHPFLLGTTTALIAQSSDLLISYFKRKVHVKNTGSIIPGHGGMLDRFDSIILTAPFLLLLV